jgi:putative flavoprotein involved in K+ transport
LVVGAGNSGAEIAFDLARAGKKPWLAGRDVGRIPWRGESLASRLFLQRALFRIVFHRLLSTETPIGRRARTKGHTTTPLIRVMKSDMKRAGITRTGRVTGVRGGKPVLENGEVLDVTNVIWSTGYELGFSWIDLPVFDSHGEPRHVRGVATDVPGLYFVGLHFLYAMSPAMIHGVGRDAAYIADLLASSREEVAVQNSARARVAVA